MVGKVGLGDDQQARGPLVQPVHDAGPGQAAGRCQWGSTAEEPKSEGEILGFCQGKYGVSFPLTAKMTVKGTDAHPFYQWAGQVLGDEAKPKWNFHKYLISADGRLVAWFSTPTKPLSPQVTQAIDAEIASANSSKRPAGKQPSGS